MTGTPETNATTVSGQSAVSHKGTFFDGSTNPKWVRGDENADDGDTLTLNERSEPNSLNMLIDNDATIDDLLKFTADQLAQRCFDDIRYWEPRLAKSWERSMICRGIAAKKNAKELAEKLNQAIPAAERERLKIGGIQAESDEILRLELMDATGDYRQTVMNALGEGAIEPQFWLYVAFEGDKFADGAPLNAKTVGERARAAIQAAPEFKGRFLPDWYRDTSVVIQVAGSGAEAEKALRAFIDSDQNKGEVIDPKSSTGKTTKKVLTFDLSERYDFEEKPVFTYNLRNDAKWHDGVPFDGRDVVFAFNTIMNPKVEGSSLRNYYQDCESVKLVDGDPYKVQFVWKKPYFLAFNFSSELYIFPEHIYHFRDAEEFNKSPKNQSLILTGPYKLDAWNRKQQMVFLRNEDYWGKKPHFNKIVVKFVDDTTVSLQMLKAGELDIHGMTKPQAKQLIADEEFKRKFGIEVSVANQFAYLGWNMRRDLFKSAKTRRALTMLVDRKRIVESIMRNFAITLDAPTHPDSPSFPKNAEKLHIPFNVEQAVKLLNEDGWSDSDGDNVLDKDFGGKRLPFKFTLLIVSGSPETESIASLIKDTFAQAGIVVNISNLEWSVFLQNIERLNFDAMISGWQVGTDDDPYQLFHSSQTGEKASNHCGFANKEVDRLIETGRRELDDARRTAMFQRVYEIIAEEQPYTCLFVSKRTVAYDKRIRNVVYKLQGKDILRWWVPKELQKKK
jgi:ABC-type transport system substrate-binding protein